MPRDPEHTNRQFRPAQFTSRRVTKRYRVKQQLGQAGNKWEMPTPDGLFANEEAPRLQKVADVVADVLKLGDRRDVFHPFFLP